MARPMTLIRTYTELSRFSTLQDRFEYLKLRGTVGFPTFAHERWMNQRFYTSREWRQIRDFVIVRDSGCDLGIKSYEVHDRIIIHHMNPMVVEDLTHGSEDILDPEYLISVAHSTHNAIHYGDSKRLPREVVERSAGDTRLW